MTTTRVGTNINANASAKVTQTAFTTVNVGDIVILWTQVVHATKNFTAMSSTNATWTRIGNWTGLGGQVLTLQLFMGIVTSVGSSTITGTPDSSFTGVLNQWTGAQFHTDVAGATWSADGAAVNGGSATAGTTMTFPGLTAANAGELAVGCMVPENTGTNGATSGWTYPTVDGFTTVWPYHLNAGAGAVTPAAATMTSGKYLSAAALFKATVPVTYPPGNMFGAYA